jgi:hypothetical protein
MNAATFNRWVRQSHRWLSVTFALFVAANFIVLGRGEVAFWIGGLTLVPLFLLLVSGLYMFALPYAQRWRSDARLRGEA